MDKEEREDYPLLDSVGDEDDGRRSTEINIDMLPDRRDSFEVAKISSPEVVGPISSANHHHITSLQGVRPIHSTAVVKSTNMADPAPLVSRMLLKTRYGVLRHSPRLAWLV